MSNKALSILVAVLALALAAVGTLFVLEKSAGAQLSAEIESLTALAETQAGEIETLTAEAAARADELESLTADAAEKDAAIESLTADMETKAGEIAEKSAAIESLTADVEARDAEIRTLNADAEAKAALIASLRADAAAKGDKIASLNADAEARAAAIEALTAEAAARADEIKTLTAEAAAQTDEIESLTADAAEKDAAIESLTADLEQKAAELELLNAAIEELQAPADVEDAFDATRAFLQRCEAEGLRCEYHGADADGDDCITVKQSGLIPFTVRVWFSGGNPTAPYLVWQYIRFSAIDRAPVLELCNLLNKEYTDMTFLVDDWDNSVSVRGMLPVSGQDTEDGDGFAAFRRMLDVMEENEEHFLPYAQ